MVRAGLQSRIPFGNVTLVNAAVSNRSGTASFFVNDGAGAQRDTLANDILGQGRPINVPLTTLDNAVLDRSARTQAPTQAPMPAL